MKNKTKRKGTWFSELIIFSLLLAFISVGCSSKEDNGKDTYEMTYSSSEEDSAEKTDGDDLGYDNPVSYGKPVNENSNTENEEKEFPGSERYDSDEAYDEPQGNEEPDEYDGTQDYHAPQEYIGTQGYEDCEELYESQPDIPEGEVTDACQVNQNRVFIPGENIFSSCYSDYSIDEKIELLRTVFPDHSYWNHAGIDTEGMSQEDAGMITTDIPCEHNSGYSYCNKYSGATADVFDYGESNTQCLGFASMISDFLFGKDASMYLFNDFDELEIGDHIRLTYYEHSMIVIEKGEDHISVVECNENYEDCMIEWDRVLTREDIESYGDGIEYIRRF